MIKQCIFDLGNVLARFDPMALTAACVSDETLCRRVCDVVFERPFWDLLDSGKLTDREFTMILRSRLPQELQDIACDVFDHWVENMPPIPGMQQLITDLKACGIPLYLISNISIGFTETYRRVPWLRDLLAQFDGLAFSAALQTVKPHGKIFEHVLETYDLTASECLFIDDSALNINGAKQVGIHGYLFDGDATALRHYLKQELPRFKI